MSGQNLTSAGSTAQPGLISSDVISADGNICNFRWGKPMLIEATFDLTDTPAKIREAFWVETRKLCQEYGVTFVQSRMAEPHESVRRSTPKSAH